MQNSTRRKFFKFGLSASAIAIGGGKAVANVCGEQTGTQSLGPFFPRPGTPAIEVKENQDPNLPPALSNDNDLTYVRGKSGSANGQIVFIRGRVIDENCSPLKNASIIIWQASSTGRYNHLGDGENHDFNHPVTGESIKRVLDPNFQYWGRVITNSKGEYMFKTIIPGFYPADLSGGWYRPPHIHFMVSALGKEQLVTQMYFRSRHMKDNEFIQTLNKRDYLLQSGNLSNGQRKKLLVDFKKGSNGNLEGRFDIQI